MTTVVRQVTTLKCLAPHPDGKRRSYFAGKLHEKRIIELPFMCQPTGRTWPIGDPRYKEPIEASGERMTIPAPCDCGIVTEYEVVSPAVQLPNLPTPQPAER